MAIKALEQKPCDDAISRQAVLDVIERETFKGDAISRIEKLPSVKSQETRWISVSERLPEDGERVLVTYDKIVIRATWDLMRYSFYDTHAVGLDKDFVYAWMPLPEPYKVESEDKE